MTPGYVALYLWMGTSTVNAAVLGETEIISRVRAHHPLLKASESDVSAAAGEFRQGRGAFDPTVRAQILNEATGPYDSRYQDYSIEQQTGLLGSKWVAGYRRGLGDYPIYDEKMRTNSEGEWRAGLEVPLLRNLITDERRTRAEVLRVGVKVAENVNYQQEQDLFRHALHRYWDWVLARAKKMAAEKLLRIAKDRDGFLQSRVKSGEAARVELLDNRRVILQRESIVIQANRSEQKSALDLSLFLWEGSTRVDPTLYNPLDALNISNKEINEPLYETPSSALESLPEINALSLVRQQREAEWALSRNQILPRLDAFANLSRDFGTGISKWNQNELRIGLQLEFPLFFNTQLGRREVQQARLLRADQQLEFARARWLNQSTDTSQSLSAARTRYTQAEEEFSLSLKLEAFEKEKFNHGDSSILILNLREQSTLEAEVKKLEIIAEWKKLQVDSRWIENKIGK